MDIAGLGATIWSSPSHCAVEVMIGVLDGLAVVHEKYVHHASNQPTY